MIQLRLVEKASGQFIKALASQVNPARDAPPVSI